MVAHARVVVSQDYPHTTHHTTFVRVVLPHPLAQHAQVIGGKPGGVGKGPFTCRVTASMML